MKEIIYQNGKVYKEAGWCTPEGYHKFALGDTTVYTHRYIYEMFNGPIPDEMDVDHIDGDKSNNKISNLRILNRADNAFNRQSANSNSKSGVRGVFFHKATQKYQVSVRGKYYGVFSTMKEAEKVANNIFKEI